jgi:hypothetical protein
MTDRIQRKKQMDRTQRKNLTDPSQRINKFSQNQWINTTPPLMVKRSSAAACASPTDSRMDWYDNATGNNRLIFNKWSHHFKITYILN